MTYLTTMTRTATPRRRAMGDALDDLYELMAGGAVSASQADPTDLINQTESGGSTTSADFTSVGGVCKARNLPAMAAADLFQSQLNRVAHMKKLPKIAIDGAIGPATLDLFRKVQSASAGSIMGDASSCLYIAADVDVLGAQVKAFADSLNAPTTVPGPISIVPKTIVTKSNQTVVAPDAGLVGAFATLSGVEKIALVGVLGGIGYLLLKKRKRK